MSFLKRLFIERRLRFDIATIFFILLASTSLFIISYTYFKIKNSVMKFAEMTIDRAGKIIRENVVCFNKEYQEIPQASDSLIISESDVSENNKSLLYYLQRKLQLHPIILSIYYGSKDGSFFNFENIKQTKQTNFYNEKEKLIPSDAVYVLETINNSINPPTRVRKYVDKDLKVLSEENIFPISYDPRTRPWYQGAMSLNKVFWTPPYQFVFPPITGVTVATPYYSDVNFQVLGVVGVDLTLQAISDFIKNQKISKNGRAFIIDNFSGEILLPLESSALQANDIYKAILQKTYKLFKETKQSNKVQEFEFGKYLTAIFEMPESFNDRWLIAVIAPIDDFFFEIFQAQKFVIFVSLLIFLFATLLVIFFSKKISKPITILANEVDKITHFDFSSPIRVSSHIKEVKVLDSSVASMREAIHSFSKYVPKDIVRHLIKQGKKISLGGEKKEIVIMFSDIENFTPIAEKNSADTLLSLLAEYYDPMSKIILESEGTIDKYIGDSIMAFWGAPEKIDNPIFKACRAALKCHHFNIEFDKKRKKLNLPPFPTRYGLAFGQVIVGNIGTEERINYTALGDAVNTAARLQTVNKNYLTSILITEELNTELKDRFITRPVDNVMVKGKENKVKIFELLAENSNDSDIGITQEKRKLASMTTEAFDALQNDKKEEAFLIYQDILKNFPNDGVACFWLNKLKG